MFKAMILSSALSLLVISSSQAFEVRADAAPAVDTKEATTVKGKIETVAVEGIGITANDAKYLFVMQKDTKITINGAEAKWSELAAGMAVSINYFREGDKYVAKSINATKD